MVADNDSGKSIMSKVRTSSGMFLAKAQVCGLLPHFRLYLFQTIVDMNNWRCIEPVS